MSRDKEGKTLKSKIEKIKKQQSRGKKRPKDSAKLKRIVSKKNFNKRLSSIDKSSSEEMKPSKKKLRPDVRSRGKNSMKSGGRRKREMKRRSGSKRLK